MPLPVVKVTSGGLPVSAATAAPGGLPVLIASNGYGVAVTTVATGGLPVTDVGGTLFGSAYTGIGDVLPNALAFWGLRGYNAAYSGPCIDICDEFGAFVTPINIVANRLNVAAVQAWETANAGQAYINKWYDQTGAGFHMLLGNQRAKLIQNAISTYPAGRFLQSHADFYKVVSGLTQAQPFFVSWVARRTANFTTAQATFASTGTNGTSTGFGGVANSVGLAAFVGANVSGAGTADSVFHAVQANFDDNPTSLNNSSIMADGTLYSGLDTHTEGLGGQMGLGCSSNASTSGFTGDLCEVGIWAGNKTTSQVALNANQHGSNGYNF